MTQHTPEPWKAVFNKHQTSVKAKGGTITHQRRANAQLIAAAPDLLDIEVIRRAIEL